jgi:hypothetical protein
MQAGFAGDFQLRADPVGGGNQQRVLEPGGLEVEQRAEASQPADHAGTAGCFREWLDRFHQGVAGVDIDA